MRRCPDESVKPACSYERMSGNLRGSGNTIRPDSVRGLRCKLAVHLRLCAPNQEVLSGDGSLQRMENVECRVVNLHQLAFLARVGWRRPVYSVQALDVLDPAEGAVSGAGCCL